MTVRHAEVELGFLQPMDEGLHLGGAVQVDVGHDPEIDGPVRARCDDFDEVIVLLCYGLPQPTHAVALDHGALTN